jgi:hypothetical protein
MIRNRLAPVTKSVFWKVLGLFLVCWSGSVFSVTPLINDGVVSGSIAIGGEIDEFTFDAVAGDAVHIRVVGGLTTAVIYNPNGTYNDNGSGLASVQSISCYESSYDCSLNQTGTYRLTVKGSLSYATGDYDIYYARVTDSNENGGLSNDDVTSWELSKGDIDTFVFEAKAGDAVSIQAAGYSQFIDPSLWLHNPDGTLVAKRRNTVACNESSYDCSLNQTGTYRLVVENWYKSWGGQYQIRFDGPRQPGDASRPVIDSVLPVWVPASAAEQLITIYGTEFTPGISGGGKLVFTDPDGGLYSTTANPERIVSVTESEWAYRLINDEHVGLWKVHVVNADGSVSNKVGFEVEVEEQSINSSFITTIVAALQHKRTRLQHKRTRLITTSWGQGDPYDFFYDTSLQPCDASSALDPNLPEGQSPDVKRYLVGCTAVAVGQLINYYVQQNYRNGWLETLLQNVTVYPRFGKAGDFFYDSCLHEGKDTEASYSNMIVDRFSDQGKQLRQFLWTVALGLDSHFEDGSSTVFDENESLLGSLFAFWTLNNSGTWEERFRSLLVDRFRFKPGVSYSAPLDSLESMRDEIVTSIDRKQPILARIYGNDSGSSSSSGHMVLIDNYRITSDDKLEVQINWGWGGGDENEQWISTDGPIQLSGTEWWASWVWTSPQLFWDIVPITYP